MLVVLVGTKEVFAEEREEPSSVRLGSLDKNPSLSFRRSTAHYHLYLMKEKNWSFSPRFLRHGGCRRRRGKWRTILVGLCGDL
jgi:hypothetical protein